MLYMFSCCTQEGIYRPSFNMAKTGGCDEAVFHSNYKKPSSISCHFPFLSETLWKEEIFCLKSSSLECSTLLFVWEILSILRGLAHNFPYFVKDVIFFLFYFTQLAYPAFCYGLKNLSDRHIKIWPFEIRSLKMNV